MNRNVITIATGKKLYVDLAINLARSFQLWNKNSGISFYIVTDLPQLIANDVSKFANIIAVKPGEFGEGFSPKIYLDQFVPDGQSLFIDSDCLVYGNLEQTFELFLGKPVSVIGGYIADGEWFGDIKKICKDHNIAHIPKFNGGVYYLEKGEIANRVYQTAREIEKNYDKIGFVRLRNRPNDEVIMALAMELEGLAPINDDGTIMSDPFACPGNYHLDIKKGKTLLINPPAPNPNHRSWYNFHIVSPLIVHFLGSHTYDYQYRSEVAKLPLLLSNRFNFLQNLKILLSIQVPAIAKIWFKNLFRPLYRILYGTRKVQISDRI